MTYLWLLLFGGASLLGEVQRLNLEEPNAWTWLLLLALASDLWDAADAATRLWRRFR